MRMGTVNVTLSMRLYSHGVVYTKEHDTTKVAVAIEPTNPKQGVYWFIRSIDGRTVQEGNSIAYTQGADTILMELAFFD